MTKIIIGVTDCSKYDRYAKWIEGKGACKALKLSHDENNVKDLRKCHGIVLTGGEDVHPRFYNKPEYLEFCYPEDISEKRDEFELRILQQSQANSLPVLGICRGLQIANVFFGGTLIPDIPSFGKFNHAKIGGVDRYHQVQIDPGSTLKKIAGADSGEVNSAHHQSAERVGSALVVNAMSADGVIEGLERKVGDGKPYLMLVQWHPERMNDQESVFTKNIRSGFLEAVALVTG